MRGGVAALFWLLGALPALAISGTVVDVERKPLEGVRVCYVQVDVELLCAATDSAGYYQLPDSRIDRIRVVMQGYLPQVLAAVDHEAPIVLERSARLLVRLKDARTGEPLDGGEVFVLAPSGRRIGPLPSNAAGVRVRTLQPGKVRVTATLAGYEQSGADSVELVAGKETALTVELTPVEKTPDAVEP